jgi:hypothetical protein
MKTPIGFTSITHPGKVAAHLLKPIHPMDATQGKSFGNKP